MQEATGVAFFVFVAVTVVGSPLRVEVKLGAKGMLHMTAIKEDPVFAEWPLNKQHHFKGAGAQSGGEPVVVLSTCGF